MSPSKVHREKLLAQKKIDMPLDNMPEPWRQTMGPILEGIDNLGPKAVPVHHPVVEELIEVSLHGVK